VGESTADTTINTSGADLIARLCSPEAYDHPVEDVTVIETHISWVLLTGKYVYKIKKPVDLGFANFSSLEQRRHFCEEEVRLNRRLAPDLYLNVVPITGTRTAPRVCGDQQIGIDGKAIEYAVQMRQFPQEALLSQLIARGAMTSDHVDRLARHLAEFHSRVPRSHPESFFGTPDAVWKAAAENFDVVAPHEELSALADELLGWSRGEFLRRCEDFATRRSQGFVRECHGDMHLGNMVLINSDVTIFDCIEFNEDFRWIDVLSEAAFVIMDLIHRGRSDFAYRLLNGYLEQTGDYGGLPVLRFYLVYRAMVRAKVCAIQFSQAESSSESRAWHDLHAYLNAASRLSRPNPIFLAVTHGLSGSGKSTVSHALLERVGAIRIRSDVERKRLFENAPEAGSGSTTGDGIYSAAATEKTYSRLAEVAEIVLCSGFPAIVDATFLVRDRRDRFRKLAEQLRIPFVILDVSAADSSLRERLARRAAEGHDASDADLGVLEHQHQIREPLSSIELSCSIPIQSSDSTSIDRAAALLQQLPCSR